MSARRAGTGRAGEEATVEAYGNVEQLGGLTTSSLGAAAAPVPMMTS
jgi:hypothetical protein